MSWLTVVFPKMNAIQKSIQKQQLRKVPKPSEYEVLLKYCLFLVVFIPAVLSATPNNGKSSQNITLQSKELTVSINKATGLPYTYNYNGTVILGADSINPIQVILCRLHPRKYSTVNVLPSSVSVAGTNANFLFVAKVGHTTAASFHVKYRLDSTSLVITMEDVAENKGYELIEAGLPNLATVREEDGKAWLAHSLGGGGLVDLKKAHPYTLGDDDNFGSIGYLLPVAVVGTGKAVCAMEVSAYMDGTKMEITGKPGHRHARIGTVQVYRVHGGRAYNMNNGGDNVPGNENTPNLLVGQKSRCRLDFTADYDGNGITDWLDGAKLVAKRMPEIPTKYFNDKFIYLIGGKYKPEHLPRTTFAQSEQLVRDIAMLTDYTPQVPLVSGWDYDGQDTGFPSEDSVNATLGGYGGLIHLMAEGAKYNANVSLNTNYDDAYKSSPVFDTAFIARQPDGKVWKGRDWAGEYSYIVGMAKYMAGYGMQRIDYSINHYKLHDAILIDAMSWFAIRNDWDINHPASGYKNLADGKYKIIDAFAKRGVNVISEQLRYPMVGKLAVTADGAGGGTCPFGGEPIPFLSAIYRKSAIWGTGDFSRDDLLKDFFWDCRSIPWFTNATNRNTITDYYYLTVVPYNKIHSKGISRFTRDGYRSLIGLEGNSEINIDWAQEDYAIVDNGIEIAGHQATYCPLDGNRLAFYSLRPQELSAPLPTGWDAATLKAFALFTDHRSPVPLSVENGMIVITVQAHRPVIVYRNDTQANERHW